MCRQNMLWGCCGIAFGLGLLIGHCFESGLLSIAIGVGMILVGLSVLRSR